MLKIEGVLIENQIYYTGVQVLELFDFKTERFRQFLKKGYIIPDLPKTTGSGKTNFFTLEGLYRIGLFKKFIDSGLHQWVASKFAQEFSYENWSDISAWSKDKNYDGDVYLVIHGKVGEEKDKNWRDYLNVEIVDWGNKSPDFSGTGIEVATIANLTEIARNIESKVS